MVMPKKTTAKPTVSAPTASTPSSQKQENIPTVPVDVRAVAAAVAKMNGDDHPQQSTGGMVGARAKWRQIAGQRPAAKK
jgi:hypothetical protein